MHHAAAIGEISLLERMVTADPTCLGVTNAGGRWRLTPLHAAVRAGNLEAVGYLFSIDAPIDAQDHNGHTALAMITECQSKESSLPIAGLLLSHGARVDPLAGHHGGTLLHRAVMNGDHSLM
ncbi:MAG: ankyrin repeat domain-containing protein, partial [bacterium]|nr:ankyrin repeat domain-containing protein [bacterium]